MSTGYITVKVFTAEKAMPIPKAQIRIIDLRIALDQTIYTDSFGNAEKIKVYAPDKTASLKPQNVTVPYETYHIEIIKEGYIPTVINNVQVFPGETCVQSVAMLPKPDGQGFAHLANSIEIPPHGLALKTERAKPRTAHGRQENKPVVIPQTIRVHLGEPDTDAKTVVVPFCQYIKTVASSEVYATWPKESLAANILAIISFVLNRIYTGYYTSQGKNFDITSMPDRDPYFVDGRNVYGNICALVDDLFNTYIKTKGTNEPLLAAYCDGIVNRCEGISQWGSVTLANQGQNAEEILSYYYGNIQTEAAKNIQGVEKDYPGMLRLGDLGDNVMIVQKQLNHIGQTYNNIPRIPKENGNFDAYTQDAVRSFQKQFQLEADGIVGKRTWYRLACAAGAVAKLAELARYRKRAGVPSAAPEKTLREGSTGSEVRLLQYLLFAVSIFYNSVFMPEMNGQFDKSTADALTSFQKTFTLPLTGTVDQTAWKALLNVYGGIERQVGPVLDQMDQDEAGYATEEHIKPEREYPRDGGTAMDKPGTVRGKTTVENRAVRQDRSAEDERIRAAMNYANMEYMVPGRETMNMAYYSDIKDYVPGNDGATYPGAINYKSLRSEPKEGTPAEKTDAGSKPQKQEDKASGSKYGGRQTENKPFIYTPWTTDDGAQSKARESGAGRDAAWDSKMPQTGAPGSGRDTEDGMHGFTGNKSPDFYETEQGKQQVQMDRTSYGMLEPELPGISRPGTGVPNMNPPDTTSDEGMDYKGNYTGYPLRMPGRDTGILNAAPPNEDNANEPYTCPAPPAADPAPPNTVLKIGSKGKNVQLMQEYLSYIALSLIRYKRDNALKVIVNDGIFGIETTDAVIRFQNRYELPVNGVIDTATWRKIVEAYNNPCE